MNALDIKVGKYTVVQHSSGCVETLRNGEQWRDCTGDNLILALAQRIEELETALLSFRNRLQELNNE